MGHGGFLMRRLENARGEFSLTALAYNIRRATTLVGIPEMIAAWGVQTSWNRPPKGLLQRIRAHGISESTTIHSRPKSKVLSHRKIRLGLLFTQSCSFTQHSPVGAAKLPGLRHWILSRGVDFKWLRV